MVSVPRFFKFKSPNTRPVLVALTLIGLSIVGGLIAISSL